MARATWEGTILAESDEGVVVENNYYFPATSLNQQYFEKNDATSGCPWKGTAHYYDVVVDGTTANAADTAVVAEYRAAGATWWLEARDWDTSEDELMARIRSGPPRVEGG